MRVKNNKMSEGEVAEYYIRVHRDAFARNERDRLDAVIHPGASQWVNRFVDYAHRLGMNKAFAYLETECGSLSNRSVLDLGCGRGRWAREYACRGARVTGVDISPDAIEVLSREMPGHRFLCQDITRLVVPKESFDVVNSVTVLQHLPEEGQRIVLRLVSSCLKHGGYLVLLENIADFGAVNVFAHRTEEWIERVESTGLRPCSHWGSNFEALFRGLHCVAKLAGGKPSAPDSAGGPVAWAETRTLKNRMKSAVKIVVALLSYPIEWCCHKLPVAMPTHSVMVFRK